MLLRDDTGAGAGLDWKNLEGESSSLMGSRTVLSRSLFPGSSCGSTRSGVFPLVSTMTLSCEAGTVTASDATDVVVDSCDSAGTCGTESVLWALLCVFVGFVWVMVLAGLRVIVDGGRGLRWSSERGIVVWPVRSLYPARPSRNRRISAF